MSSPVISDELKKSLRSVLLSKAGGVELHRIAADYMKFVGRPLLYQQYGFRNVHSFLQALPDVARYVVSLGRLTLCRRVVRHRADVSSDVVLTTLAVFAAIAMM